MAAILQTTFSNTSSNPSFRYLFYTSIFPINVHVGRATLAGHDRTDIAVTDLRKPVALTIDFEEDMIYWADAVL